MKITSEVSTEDFLIDLGRDFEREALSDICSGYGAFRPPKRVTVAEGAAATLVIKQPGGYSGPWSADEAPYMVEPMNEAASRTKEAVCFVGPARTGKCLHVETPIPTESGWVRMQDICVGDRVVAPDGTLTDVTYVADVKVGRPCFEVEFSDGETLIADDEHLWGVERFYWNAPNWRYEVRSTAELLEDLYYSPRSNGKRRFRYRVRNVAPIQFPEAELSIDPYCFGVWLGNGSSGQASVSCWREDESFYATAFSDAGYCVRVLPDSHGNSAIGVDRRVDMSYEGLFRDSFQEALRNMSVLGNKRIPQMYLRASFKQRLALLQGLMDTDGYPGADGRAPVEFSTVHAGLKDDFLELARSLGLKPIAKHKTTTWTYEGDRKHGKAWAITFPVPSGVQVFTIPRKLAKLQYASIDVGFRQIVAIRPVESVPVRCIEVAHSSHLFLAGKGMVPTHNTAGLIVGWMSHAVVNDPGDMIIVQMTQDKAREFSKTDIDRALRHSPKLKALMGRSQDDNTHDKAFKHGMWLRIAWPTVSNLSGSTYRYVALTDYDRMPDDIDGEGPAFDLGLKRTTTFMSRGMCVVESSPGRPLEDPNWQPTTPHEAPPTKGILGIYNRSDLRRWYWKCPHCGAWFEAKPGLELFMLPDEDELMERVREEDIEEMVKQYNRVVCPASGCIIGPGKKNSMNARGRWVAEGQYFDADDNIVGKPRSSTIAGFWMGGVAAAYQNWRSLLGNYFQALRTYALSGDEGPLQKTVNTDQGMPYMSRLLSEAARRAVNPRDRKEKKMQRYIVPDETRFVTAQVDVQGGLNARFVVQVHAHGPHNEQWVVDRYAITESDREGMGGKAPIDPAQHPEDWDVLTERVVLATYRTSIEGTEIRVKMTAVDSGGEHKAKKVGERRAEGVTVNAYDWYRRLRRKGLHNRVMLVKGASSRDAPLIKETLVGNRNPREKGDVPLYVINPNLLKDVVSTGLKRPLPGPGYIHLPSWLPDAFFDELQAEIRNPDGTWTQRKARNEAFDLAAYGQATRLRLGADKINWQRPPDWAKPIFDGNIEVITREERREMKADEEYSEVDDEPSEVIEDAPSPPQPAAPPPVARKVARRTARSSYLR